MRLAPAWFTSVTAWQKKSPLWTIASVPCVALLQAEAVHDVELLPLALVHVEPVAGDRGHVLLEPHQRAAEVRQQVEPLVADARGQQIRQHVERHQAAVDGHLLADPAGLDRHAEAVRLLPELDRDEQPVLLVDQLQPDPVGQRLDQAGLEGVHLSIPQRDES